MAVSNAFYPLLWLFVFAVLAGILLVSSNTTVFRRKATADAATLTRLDALRRVVLALATTLLAFSAGFWLLQERAERQRRTAEREALLVPYDPQAVWEAPNPQLAETAPDAEAIAYGRDLIVHTQDYFGPYGIVRPASINALNCQSCHLDAGAKPYGNNYSAVFGTYPQYRARSGTLETVAKRVNDCFERSLNGAALDTNSREMHAIKAYIAWLGSGVPPGIKPKGSGIPEVPFLDRAADPVRGKYVYDRACASCHGADGQGLPMPESARTYPPLWGQHSYNQAAGLYRLSRLAGFVKANMPFGASYQNPQLTDEEAWDVAAYINSQPRPLHPFLETDWPDIEKKPYDHPFGPYRDTFAETQHRFGPFPPILNQPKTAANGRQTAATGPPTRR